MVPRALECPPQPAIMLLHALSLLLLPQDPTSPLAQGPVPLQEAVVEHRLENGWTFLILPREGPPIVSFETLVDVGLVDEPPGLGGLVHMFEHLAFKGSDRIGSLDWPAEEAALARVDELHAELRIARASADDAQSAAIEADWREALTAASSLVQREEFSRLMERAGGAESMNASTTADHCRFFVSLPSNQVELWCWLESERFLRPVLRELYLERDAVLEERSMRVEANDIGTLLEELAASTFRAHPYGRPVIGSREDIQRYDRASARAFFDAKWGPAQCTTAIVGDIDPESLIPRLEAYFGRIPARPQAARDPAPLAEQRGERRARIEFPSQPLLAIGWPVPPAKHTDAPAIEVAIRLLGAARTSRLERRLLREDPLCARVLVANGWPGNKQTNLAYILAMPLEGADLREVEAAILEEVLALAEDGPEPAELEGVVRVARIEHQRSMRQHAGLARGLLAAQSSHGDWRAHFHRIAKLEAVTTADVQRVLRVHFIRSRRTIIELGAAAATREPQGPDAGEEDEE